MRLLADLHISPRTVELLRSLGHDVVRADELKNRPSLISLRLSSSRIEYVNTILQKILPAVEQDVLSGMIITVEDDRIRRRPLPIE
jgi:predicted nuclease of predicted toxin-antitoxin system